MVNPNLKYDIEIESRHGEAVSAVMDGEAGADDWHWLDNEAARRCWHDYHIVRECMRASGQQSLGGGLSEETLARLSQRLRDTEQETVRKDEVDPLALTFTAPTRLAANHALFRRFAIAASMAGVLVAAWQLWPQTIAPAGLSQAGHRVPAKQAVVPLAAPKPADVPAAVKPAAAQARGHSASEAAEPPRMQTPVAVPAEQSM